MKLSFFGAAGTVTGSCAHLQTKDAEILIDAGLFQGGAGTERRNAKLPPLKFGKIDAVLLTHAHLDHCGRLPIFAKRGLRSPIYATPATCDLARLILTDAAHIQNEDAKRQTRRNLRRGKAPALPLFDFGDVFKTTQLFERVSYGETFEVAKGIRARYHDAGHILGSAMVELWLEDGTTKKHIVFSGDIGMTPQPILANPAILKQAQLVVLESTYGDRNHRSPDNSLLELRDIIEAARHNRGKILIPSFAVGRTQTLLYHFREFYEKGWLKGVPVYLDSPMAIEATHIYDRYPDLYDAETSAVKARHKNPICFPTLDMLSTADDSRSINELEGPAIIIAGSGMCNGGRILHHLRHHLWRENTQVVFVGFQAEGTLGRRLIDGARTIKIMGDPIRVRARINTVGGFSAHADQTQLLDWIKNFGGSNPRVILNHGEDRSRLPLQEQIQTQTGFHAILADERAPIEL